MPTAQDLDTTALVRAFGHPA
ncbi:hypothetical protein ACQPYV_22560 [Micromonospora saelicesensis]